MLGVKPLRKPHWYRDRIFPKYDCIWSYKYLSYTLETFDKVLTGLLLSFQLFERLLLYLLTVFFVYKIFAKKLVLHNFFIVAERVLFIHNPMKTSLRIVEAWASYKSYLNHVYCTTQVSIQKKHFLSYKSNFDCKFDTNINLLDGWSCHLMLSRLFLHFQFYFSVVLSIG